MGKLGRIAERLPLVPTWRSLGGRMLGRTLARVRGEADFVGLVLGDDGWEVIPCNMVKQGEQQWGVPLDEELRPFPADGIPMEPSAFYGTPVAIGYKDFGSLNEIPNQNISRDVIITVENSDGDDGDDDDDDGEETVTEPSRLGRAGQRLKGGVVRVATAPGRGLSRARSRFAAWEETKGWQWLQGDAGALVLEQDGDSKLVAERADYQTGEDGPDWYEARRSGYYYDARGAGAPPTSLDGSDFSVAHAQTPKLLAPVLCRLARNMHEGRIVAPEQATFGGDVKHVQGDGDVLATDGGRDVASDGGTQAKSTVATHGDIMVEERAFVQPEDVKLLGGAQETQDKIQTLKKQVEAKENLPGGNLGKRLLDFGKIVISFILGAVLAGGGGGGGGGGGSIPSSPVFIDPTPLVDLTMHLPAAALEVVPLAI